jgi:hypothetical protein
MSATFLSAYTFSLRCEDCDQVFITYDPNAERGPRISVGDVANDTARHRRECRWATSQKPEGGAS